MKVIFYTATCYMDMSLEIINILKDKVELHVIIEITPKSKNQSIIDIKTLPINQTFASPKDLLTTTSYNYMKPYFKGTCSTNFLIYHQKNTFSSLKTCYKLYKYINKIKPEILHIEALLIRSIFIIPSIFKLKKVFLTIHDPIPHLGEKDYKIRLINFIYFNISKLKGFFFYSHFAKRQFENNYNFYQTTKYVIKMNPLFYFRNLESKINTVKKNILFFGRLSQYKGIDVLLKAMPEVLHKFPNEQLIIAGRSINNYKIPSELLQKQSNNITVLDRHISNEELAKLIKDAKFVVCPYLEATQSGVLMTSLALNTPVIASAVGAFTEYVKENINGSLIPSNDPIALAEKINTFLERDHYKVLEKSIRQQNKYNQWDLNASIFLKAYKG